MYLKQACLDQRNLILPIYMLESRDHLREIDDACDLTRKLAGEELPHLAAIHRMDVVW